MGVEDGRAVSVVSLPWVEPVLPVTSTGRSGKDFGRSFNRAYWNLDSGTAADADGLYDAWYRFLGESLGEESGDAGPCRRSVMRLRATDGVAAVLTELGLPVETDIPLEAVGMETDDHIVILGHNHHPSPVPEAADVAGFWRSPHEGGHRRTPEEFIDRLPRRYRVAFRVTASDLGPLAALWGPFGWTPDAVAAFIAGMEAGAEGVWFSGIRDADGTLVSATQGEELKLSGIRLIEATEVTTAEGHEGRGLATAAMTGLIAAILNDTRDATGELPLVYSEFDMTSRSDYIGRSVGMTVPFFPDGRLPVLRLNVAIRDRKPPQPGVADWFAGTRFPFTQREDPGMLRNFVMAYLDRKGMERYDRAAVGRIVALGA
jgi:hypothetical protein